MKLRQLKYFVTTAEMGQVSRAAAALSVSQSSVTSAIQSLETTLDTPLFVRGPHGMELTGAGWEFFGAAREILEKVDEAKNLRAKASPISGTVSMAATYTVMGYFLPYHLEKLSNLHPNLDIRLHELHRENIEEGLLSNRFDLAVLLTSNLSNPDIESETLVRSTRRLWVPNGHPFTKQNKVSFREIAEEDYIMLTVDEAAHTAMKYWRETGYLPKVRLRTSSVESVRSLVGNGQGIAILSDAVYRPWSLEGRRINTVSTERPVPTMDIGLAWRRGAEFDRPTSVIATYFKLMFLTPQSHAP